METTELTEDIHWVGAIDWNLWDFDGYATRRGNAYLIVDEIIAVVYTMKYAFADDMFERRMLSIIN